MADTAPRPHPNRKHHRRTAKPHHKKLLKLPPTAKINKRPLLHPAIPPPHAGSTQQKCVYVSGRTPFISVVKRVEKLLHLSDKRLVQAATTLAKQKQMGGYGQGRKRKRGADSDGEEDEVVRIAREVERMRGKKRRVGDGGGVGENREGVGVEGAEEVLIKGTGKAIARVMEMGLWFQQRDEYVVRLRTGSVGAVDDIVVESEPDEDGDERGGSADQPLDGHDKEASADAEDGDGMDVEVEAVSAEGAAQPEPKDQTGIKDMKKQFASTAPSASAEPIPETRIRYMSMLEVAVSLR